MKFSEGLLSSLLKVIGIVGASLVFFAAQEHRMTKLEENIVSMQQVMSDAKQTQQLMSRRMDEEQATLTKLVTLEDFIHGISDDEAAAGIRPRHRKP